MKRYTGRLERRDLAGGVWVLHTSEGEKSLYGEVPRQLDGQRVEVEGEAEEAFGIGMTGPGITVRTVRKA